VRREESLSDCREKRGERTRGEWWKNDEEGKRTSSGSNVPARAEEEEVSERRSGLLRVDGEDTVCGGENTLAMGATEKSGEGNRDRGKGQE
jgi:hypothetical protein